MFSKVLLLVITLLSAVSARAQKYVSELKMSTEETVYFYRICNASFGMQDYVMTDCSNEKDVIQVQLQSTEVTDERSQWKLTNVGNEGKVVLTNRCTGLQLGGVSLNMGNHNSTQLTVNGSSGFIITSLGEDAFSLKCIEDDGVERCLAMAERESPAIVWPEEKLSTSVIGWKFIPIESHTTGIYEKKNVPVINVVDKRIFVRGCSNWQLYSLSGKEIPSNTILTAGVYLIKTSDGVVKVVVQ